MQRFAQVIGKVAEEVMKRGGTFNAEMLEAASKKKKSEPVVKFAATGLDSEPQTERVAYLPLSYGGSNKDKIFYVRSALGL